MAQSLQVYLFGDENYDFYRKLRTLLHSTSDPILAAFFEQACDIIRVEIGKLPFHQRAEYPRFRTLADLVARQIEGGSAVFQTALACIYQIGLFISKHGESGRAYPQASETYLVGLCTGAFAAAAISSSKSLSELLPAGVEAARVALRFGLCTVDVRERIEPNSNLSWSMIVAGFKPDAASEALAEFSKAHRLPPTSRPWVGAQSTNATTISGPPSVLGSLVRSGVFSKFKIMNIPIRVPAHASHLFSDDDVKWILKVTSISDWSSYTSKIPVVSSATGKLQWAGNFRSLLETAIGEILMQPLRWDLITEEFPQIVRGASQIKITPIATKSENMLYTALKDSVQNGMESTKYWPHSSYLPSPEELSSASIEIDYQDKVKSAQTSSGRPELSKIAIVGMSGRFPEASNPEAFWDLLHQGLDVVKEVPAKRWDVKTHVDPTLKTRNAGGTPWGCWLDDAGLFDPRFFGVSPKEAPQLDPGQRLALMSTYEAMEQAGIVPGATPSTQKDRIGVFHGITSNDWMETNSAQDVDTYFIVGGNRAFVPGRINFCFDFSGPSFAIDTACSSSLAAINLACNALWRGDIDTAVAGGTNMVNNPDGHTGLDRGFFLSRTGNCKPFDDNADGYCRAEGVGTVFLKRLEDALADGDPIQGVILGASTNHSAESESITRPHIGTQKAIFDKVLNDTGIDPYDLSYIEMHGTGTQVGDAVEMTSVLDTFAPTTTSNGGRRRDQSLHLGAAKANVGHGEGVSGVTSLVKVLLMMKKNEIPPHCGIKPGSKINHTFPTNLDERNVHIAFEPTEWRRPENDTRKVLINNFSAAGGNTALLIEDPPIVEADSQEIDPRSSHVVIITAKCPVSVKGNIKSLMQYIDGMSEQGFTLPQLSYTTTARRMQHLHRVAVTGSNLDEIKTRLGEALARGDGTTRAKSAPKIVFAFTGQGAQYLGMGKQLFDTFTQFRGNILRFDQLARSQGFPSFQRVFTETDGEIGEFTPLIVQLATTCMQMALVRLWSSWGVTPATVVGHSLGEYAALNVAGVLTDSDTIYLVGKRAELLQEQCRRGTHSMLAVHASTKTLESLLAGKKYEIACINGPEDTVLGGSNEQISSLQAVLAAHKLKMTILKVPYAFHTSQVDPILDSFEAVAQGITFHKPSIPVICPLTGDVVSEVGHFNAKYLTRHCREAVNIRDALLSAQEQKVISDKSFVVEIGPHSVVSGMIKATLGPKLLTFPTLQRNKDTWPLLTSALSALFCASHDIKWIEFHRDFKYAHKVLHLPAYSWDLKDYWMQYTGDWCLTRGNPNDPNAVVKAIEAAPQEVIPKPVARPVPIPKLETSTVHRIVEENSHHQKATLIAESDFTRTDLNDIAKGHKVNQIPLTTPSVYADMALTVGKYLLDRFQPAMKERLVDVSDLVVEKALIPHSQGPQLVRTLADVDWTDKSAKCKFYSVDANGKTTMEHAWCTIRFRDRSHIPAIQSLVPEYFTRMDRLRKGIEDGNSLRVNQTVGYKLIASLAQFHPDYRAIDELVLDSETLEASSKVSFGQVKKGGSFSTHPAYIDVLTQTAGFIMNVKDSTDLETEIFVNHGWDSFQVFEEISPEKTYSTYARMSRHEGTLWKGDTAMFDGDKIVAYFKGVALKGVPRAVFKVILASADKQNPNKGGKAPARPTTKVPVAQAPKAVAPVKPAPTSVPTPAPAATPAPVPAPIPQAKVEIIAPAAAIAVAERDPERAAKVQSAMEIVAEESGIAMDDLTDDCSFSDIGVDSLLSMVIASRFREELGLDLDVEFSIFLDLPTVKHLKDFLDPPSDADPEQAVAKSYVESAVVVTAPAAPVQVVPVETKVEEPVQIPAEPEKAYTPPATTYVQNSSPTSELIDSALAVVAEESGIAIDDLTDDCSFTEIGVDSLLSMVIASRFREELGLDLDIEFSIFLDLPTVKDLKVFLNGGGSDSQAVMVESSDGSGISTPDKPSDRDVISLSDGESGVTTPDTESEPKRTGDCRPATSVILQGFPKAAEKTLFLLPDGGGSSSSYVPFPRFKSEIALVGLNCPYGRDPWDMKCHYDDLIDSYMTEIRRRQPNGPYYLGGWSSGGIMAFMAAQRFIQQGEEVPNLIIIDSPVPRVMDRLPTKFYEFCDAIGLFGYALGQTTPSVPDYLVPHFNATVEVLAGYHATPIPSQHKIPKVSIIWAAQSVLDERNLPPEELLKSKGIHFLLEKRKDFGTCGWETLLPGTRFEFETVDGNHFTMMQKPLINQVGAFIAKALA